MSLILSEQTEDSVNKPKKDLRGLSSPLGEGEKEDVSRKESFSCTGRNGMRGLACSTLKSAGFL